MDIKVGDKDEIITCPKCCGLGLWGVELCPVCDGKEEIVVDENGEEVA